MKKDPFKELNKFSGSQISQTQGTSSRDVASEPFKAIADEYSTKKASYKTVKINHVRK